MRGGRGKTQISRTRIHTNRFYDGRREGTRGGAFLPGGHGMRRRRYIFVSRGLVARSASYPRLAYTINRSPEGISAVGGRWLCQGWCRDPLRGTNIISAHTPGATSSAVAPGGKRKYSASCASKAAPRQPLWRQFAPRGSAIRICRSKPRHYCLDDTVLLLNLLSYCEPLPPCHPPPSESDKSA